MSKRRINRFKLAAEHAHAAGKEPNPVLDERQRPIWTALLNRIWNGEKNGAYSDGLNIAAAIEGGGKAGVMTAGAWTGMIHAAMIMGELKKNGGDLEKAYDTVIENYMRDPARMMREGVSKLTCLNSVTTCSSGSYTGAFGLMGNGDDATNIYFNPLMAKPGDPRYPGLKAPFTSTGRGFWQAGLLVTQQKLPALAAHVPFLNPDNVVPGMDLSFLSDVTMGRYDPSQAMDLQGLLDHGTSLRIVQTNLDTQERVVKEVFNSPLHLQKEIEVGCLIPGVCGDKVEGADGLVGEKGARFVDGAYLGNCPIDVVPKEADYVLVFRASAKDASPRKGLGERIPGAIIRRFVLAMAKDFVEFNELVTKSEEMAETNAQAVDAAMQDPKYMFMGAPSGWQSVSSDCKDGKLLRDSGFAAYRESLLTGLNWMKELGYVQKGPSVRLERGAVKMPVRWTKPEWSKKQNHKPHKAAALRV